MDRYGDLSPAELKEKIDNVLNYLKAIDSLKPELLTNTGPNIWEISDETRRVIREGGWEEPARFGGLVFRTIGTSFITGEGGAGGGGASYPSGGPVPVGAGGGTEWSNAGGGAGVDLASQNDVTAITNISSGINSITEVHPDIERQIRDMAAQAIADQMDKSLFNDK